MRGQALGLIEVYGYIAAIEAADSAVKSANIELVALEKVKGGRVTVILSGDVGSVKAAVESGKESARRLGNYKSSHVIPRPFDEVSQMLLKTQIKNEEDKVNIASIDEEKLSSVEPAMETELEQLQEKVSSVEVQMAESEIKNKISDSDQLFQRLNGMTVVELRKMARNLKMGTMTNKNIKYARKRNLIEEITRFNEGNDK